MDRKRKILTDVILCICHLGVENNARLSVRVNIKAVLADGFEQRGASAIGFLI
jgi:hypothetical protein